MSVLSSIRSINRDSTSAYWVARGTTISSVVADRLLAYFFFFFFLYTSLIAPPFLAFSIVFFFLFFFASATFLYSEPRHLDVSHSKRSRQKTSRDRQTRQEESRQWCQTTKVRVGGGSIDRWTRETKRQETRVQERSSSFFCLFREFSSCRIFSSTGEFINETTNEIVPFRRCSTSLEATVDSQQLDKNPTPLSTRSAWADQFPRHLKISAAFSRRWATA